MANDKNEQAGLLLAYCQKGQRWSWKMILYREQCLEEVEGADNIKLWTALPVTIETGVRWNSGNILATQPEGCRLEYDPSHCLETLDKYSLLN